MTADDVVSADERRTILGAALNELRVVGIDRFSIHGVAARVGVDPGVITGVWHDRRVLLMDAVLGGAQEQVPLPDTGTLRGDLAAYAQGQIAYHEAEQRRALFHLFLPNHGDDLDGTEVRTDFWAARVGRLSTMMERAAARGELREGVDPLEAMRMLIAALNFDTVYADSTVRPDYAAHVVDIFIRGVTRWPDD